MKDISGEEVTVVLVFEDQSNSELFSRHHLQEISNTPNLSAREAIPLKS